MFLVVHKRITQLSLIIHMMVYQTLMYKYLHNQIIFSDDGSGQLDMVVVPHTDSPLWIANQYIECMAMYSYRFTVLICT